MQGLFQHDNYCYDLPLVLSVYLCALVYLLNLLLKSDNCHISVYLSEMSMTKT